MSTEDEENEMKAGDGKMYDDVVLVNKDDTEDRLAVLFKKLDQLKESISGPRERIKEINAALKTVEEGSVEDVRLLKEYRIQGEITLGLNEDVQRMQEKEKQLRADLSVGKYFAKSTDVFPITEAIHVSFDDIKGKSDGLYRSAHLKAYYNQTMGPVRKDLSRHLEDDNTSRPDIRTPTPSSASESDASSAPAKTSVEGKNSRDRIKNIQHTVAGASTSKDVKQDADEACIIDGADGHRGHQGPNGKTCAAWWAPIYLWMVGITDEMSAHLSKINEATDEEVKKNLIVKLHEAMVMLAFGTFRGSKGMKDAKQNILYVPDPHSKYYDEGCNWVIYPVMTLDQMLDWAGESYEVAIWAGEKFDDDPRGKGHWNDGKSKHNAESAEKVILSYVEKKPEDIKVCSTSDLQMIAEGMGLLGPAIADWHTRAPDETTYKFKILDLSSAIEDHVALKTTTVPKIDEVKGLKEIKAGLIQLASDLQEKGIYVPKPPTTNHFGPEGKHVYKTQIKQTHAPDPLVVAVKGLNNLLRQRGTRLMPGCPSYDSVSPSGSISGSSSVGDSAVTPTDFVGTEIAIVTPPSLPVRTVAKADITASDDDDTCSEISAISFDGMPSL
jgi:hypothetical protein